MSGSSRPSAKCWASCLKRLDVDVPSVELDQAADTIGCFDSTETYTTAVGPVTCRGARCIAVRARTRGSTDGASRRHCRGALDTTGGASGESRVVAADDAERRREALLRELGNMAPSKSSLDRLPKGLNARWEANREAVRIDVARGGGGAR